MFDDLVGGEEAFVGGDADAGKNALAGAGEGELLVEEGGEAVEGLGVVHGDDPVDEVVAEPGGPVLSDGFCDLGIAAPDGDAEDEVGFGGTGHGANVFDEGGDLGGPPGLEGLDVGAVSGDVGGPVAGGDFGVALEGLAGGGAEAGVGVGVADVVEVEAVEGIGGDGFAKDVEHVGAVGGMGGVEPVAGGAGGVLLEAAFFFAGGDEVGGGVFDHPTDDPEVDGDVVAAGGGDGLLELVAIVAEGEGGGDVFAGVVGEAGPEGVDKEGVDAVVGEEFAGAVPVAGVEAGAVVFPDAADFSGAGDLDEAVGGDEGVAKAVGGFDGGGEVVAGGVGEHGAVELAGAFEEGEDGGAVGVVAGLGGDLGDGVVEGAVAVDFSDMVDVMGGGGLPEGGVEGGEEAGEHAAFADVVVFLKDVGEPESVGGA